MPNYSVLLAATLFFMLLDLIATSCVNTLHLKDRSLEDLLNIVGLVVHGLIIMGRFVVMLWSASGTKQFRAGLFGELLKVAYKPLAALTMHIGVMPMPWVYRRWILKNKLYWDNTIYILISATNFTALFLSVYYTAILHCELANPDKYEPVDRLHARPRPSMSFLLGADRGIGQPTPAAQKKSA